VPKIEQRKRYIPFFWAFFQTGNMLRSPMLLNNKIINHLSLSD
jgi:hypothetical protein